MSGLERELNEDESVELVERSLYDLDADTELENSLVICSSKRPFSASSMAFW